MRSPYFDMAGPVALRIAVCSRMIEADPSARLPPAIVEAMRRRIAVESAEAIRLHNEAFPRTPYTPYQSRPA